MRVFFYNKDTSTNWRNFRTSGNSLLSFFAFIFLFFPNSALAQSAPAYAGMIQPYFFGSSLYLAPMPGGVAWFVPQCARRGLYRLILAQGAYSASSDPVTTQAQLSILMSAFYAGHPVYLIGDGTCTSEGDTNIFVIIPN